MNVKPISANNVAFYKYGKVIAVASPERGGWKLVDMYGEAVGGGEPLPSLGAAEAVVLSKTYQEYVDKAHAMAG